MRTTKFFLAFFVGVLCHVTLLQASDTWEPEETSGSWMPSSSPSSSSLAYKAPKISALKRYAKLEEQLAECHQDYREDFNAGADFDQMVPRCVSVWDHIQALTSLLIRGVYLNPSQNKNREGNANREGDAKRVVNSIYYGFRETPANLSEKTRTLKAVASLAKLAARTPLFESEILKGLYYNVGFEKRPLREQSHVYLVRFAYQFIKASIPDPKTGSIILPVNILQEIGRSPEFRKFFALQQRITKTTIDMRSTLQQLGIFLTTFESKGRHMRLAEFIRPYSPIIRRSENKGPAQELQLGIDHLLSLKNDVLKLASVNPQALYNLLQSIISFTNNPSGVGLSSTPIVMDAPPMDAPPPAPPMDNPAPEGPSVNTAPSSLSPPPLTFDAASLVRRGSTLKKVKAEANGENEPPAELSLMEKLQEALALRRLVSREGQFNKNNDDWSDEDEKKDDEGDEGDEGEGDEGEGKKKRKPTKDAPAPRLSIGSIGSSRRPTTASAPIIPIVTEVSDEGQPHPSENKEKPKKFAAPQPPSAPTSGASLSGAGPTLTPGRPTPIIPTTPPTSASRSAPTPPPTPPLLSGSAPSTPAVGTGQPIIRRIPPSAPTSGASLNGSHPGPTLTPSRLIPTSLLMTPPTSASRSAPTPPPTPPLLSGSAPSTPPSLAKTGMVAQRRAKAEALIANQNDTVPVKKAPTTTPPVGTGQPTIKGVIISPLFTGAPPSPLVPKGPPPPPAKTGVVAQGKAVVTRALGENPKHPPAKNSGYPAGKKT